MGYLLAKASRLKPSVLHVLADQWVQGTEEVQGKGRLRRPRQRPWKKLQVNVADCLDEQQGEAELLQPAHPSQCGATVDLPIWERQQSDRARALSLPELCPGHKTNAPTDGTIGASS